MQKLKPRWGLPLGVEILRLLRSSWQTRAEAHISVGLAECALDLLFSKLSSSHMPLQLLGLSRTSQCVCFDIYVGPTSTMCIFVCHLMSFSRPFKTLFWVPPNYILSVVSAL